MQYEAAFMWNDLKLAKFWMDLANNEKDKFWAKIQDEQSSIVENVRASDVYKANSKEFEGIKEEPEEEEETPMHNTKLGKLNK